MHGSTGSAWCLALLMGLGIMAQEQLNDTDIKHSEEQASVTEDTTFVNERIDEERRSQDRSGTDETPPERLVSAPAIAQTQTTLLPAAVPADEASELQANSNFNDSENSSLDLYSSTREAPILVADVDDTSSLSTSGSQRRASSLYEPEYSRKLITRNEMIYLQNTPGSENLVICTREGEFYNLRTPWKECLVCVCVRESGRVQPACVKCAGCAGAAPLPPPRGGADLLQPVLHSDKTASQAEQDIKVPGTQIGVKESCAPFPYGAPFEHPLNPCQICLCQKKPSTRGEVLVSCVRDSRCVKPLDIPVLPPTPTPQSQTPTPLCEKFPKYVEFPHPTDACKKCKCLEHVSAFNIPELLLTCYPDPNCGEAVSQPHLPVAEPLDQEQLQRPMGPESGQLYHQANPLFQLDTFLFPPTANMLLTTGSPLANIIGESDTNLLQLLNEPALLPLSPTQPQPLIPTQKKAPFDATSLFDDLSRPQQQNVQVSPPGQEVPLVPYAPQFSSKTSDSVIGNKRPLYPPYPARPDYSIRPDLPLHSEPTGSGALQSLQKEALSWPPLTIPAFPKKSYGPLLGPAPHESCAPYPAGTPFRHPWDECQVCACHEYAAPGRLSIEVNCYTKASCCAISPDSGPSLTSGQISSQSEAAQKSVQITEPEITYIETRCRHKAPNQPFMVHCSVCVCTTVFTFVVARCTLLPQCTQKPSESGYGSVNVQVLSDAHSKSGYISTLVPGYQSQTVSPLTPSGSFTPNTKDLTQLQQRDIYLNGQYSLNEIYENQLASRPSIPQQASNIFASHNQYSPANLIKPSAGSSSEAHVINQATAHLYQSPLLSLGRPAVTSTPIGSTTQGSTSLEAFIEAINGPYQKKPPPAYFKHPNAHSQDPTSLEALIEAINGKDQKKHDSFYYEYPNAYSRGPSGSDLKIGSSTIYPLNTYGYQTQKTPNLYQNDLQTEFVSPIPGTGSRDPDNIRANAYYLSKQWNLKQAEASANEVSSTTFLPRSSSHTSSSVTPFLQKSTLSPPIPSLWDSTTLAYEHRDSGARAQQRALAGPGNAPVTRTGRGQCQYAGDMYHRNCQACYCFADEETAGDIYSMCMGKPCR